MSSSDRDPSAPAKYVSLTAELSESDVEQAEIVFHESGALGLEVREPGLLPMPGAEPLMKQSSSPKCMETFGMAMQERTP